MWPPNVAPQRLSCPDAWPDAWHGFLGGPAGGHFFSWLSPAPMYIYIYIYMHLLNPGAAGCSPAAAAQAVAAFLVQYEESIVITGQLVDTAGAVVNDSFWSGGAVQLALYGPSSSQFGIDLVGGGAQSDALCSHLCL